MPVTPSPILELGRGICGNYPEASEREWLETNGRGGYSFGTVAGGNTRRYHGLLTVPRRPPLDRVQVVNRLEETVIAGGQRTELSCQAYPDTISPKGFERLESFRLDPFPIWTFGWTDGRLEKTLFMRYGEDTVLVTYRLLSGAPVDLELRPFLSGRDHHVLGKESHRFDSRVHGQGRTLAVDFPEGYKLTVQVSDGKYASGPTWYRNQTYLWEDRRGIDKAEDAFSPGVFRAKLAVGAPLRLAVSTGREAFEGVEGWEEEEREQRRKIVQGSLVRGALGAALTAAADQFIVSRGDGITVIAGYPWFEDWSRDALISLPGLFLATGRWKEAPTLLDTFARHVHEGLLPNRFPEKGAATLYNAVDSPLWFVRAAQAYYKATDDDESLRRWLPVMREIVDAYQGGTSYDIHMDTDGLIVVPESDVPLTWMDAYYEGKSITPRAGKPVEIQALWYNALQFLMEVQLKFKEPTRGYDQLASVARKSFNEKFWSDEHQYVFDVLTGTARPMELRPNGLFAVSLPYEILEEKHFRPLVETVWWELHTPRGIRTLSVGNPEYRGKYIGALADRDRAYHNGSVWPWLLGPFMTAYTKAFGTSDETKRQLVRFLQPFVHHLSEAGLGSVSEIFDGDPPHTAQGCPAQAWSVAELLRVMWEEGITL